MASLSLPSGTIPSGSQLTSTSSCTVSTPVLRCLRGLDSRTERSRAAEPGHIRCPQIRDRAFPSRLLPVNLESAHSPPAPDRDPAPSSGVPSRRTSSWEVPMPYRFTPVPFSGPAPLLHPTAPPDSGRPGPVETVRPLIREATRVLTDEERVPAPDPGRYHPKPSAAPSASHTTYGTECSGAPASAPAGADGPSRLAETAGGTADGQLAARVTARTPQEHVPVGAEGSEAVSGADGVRMEDNRAVSEEEHHNEVLVAGRITAEPRFRELPSGDHLATWRICVARHPSTRFRGRREIGRASCRERGGSGGGGGGAQST